MTGLMFWKFLQHDGTSPFAGFDWRATAGRWVDTDEREQCRTGIHGCRVVDLPYWLGQELWGIEIEDAAVSGHKVVGRRGRLGEKVAAWTDSARDLTMACVGRTAHHAAEEQRSAGLDGADELFALAQSFPSDPDGERLRTVARAAADDAARRRRRQANRLAMLVVDCIDYLDEVPVATIAYIAARAANSRSTATDDDPYAAERAWQAKWMSDRLGLMEQERPPRPRPGPPEDTGRARRRRSQAPFRRTGPTDP